jgi:hypothetical protein
MWLTRVADPADGVLHGMEHRQQQVALARHRRPPMYAAIALDVRAAPSQPVRRQQAIDRIALCFGGLGADDMQVMIAAGNREPARSVSPWP